MSKDNGYKVQIGRIVHAHWSRTSNCLPALVTRVRDQEGVSGKADLAVFAEDGSSVGGRQEVLRDPTPAGDGLTWHWPTECSQR